MSEQKQGGWGPKMGPIITVEMCALREWKTNEAFEAAPLTEKNRQHWLEFVRTFAAESNSV